MITVVAYPHIHFFSSFKNASFNKQRFKLDSPEFAIFGFNGFLSFISQIQMINFIIKEHIERNLFPHFVLIKIDIPGIINRADYILYARSDFKKPVSAYGRSGFMIKGYIIINF